MSLTRSSYQKGSLRKVSRSSGFAWEFRYRVAEDGKPKQKQISLSGSTYPSESAARRKLEALVVKLNSDSSDSFTDMLMGALIDAFIETEMPERPKSRINYLLLLNRHIRPHWAETRLSRVVPHAVEMWLAAMTYAPATRRHIRNMMFRLFELAMRKGWMQVQRNPIELVRVRGTARTREIVTLTPDQAETIVSALADPHRLMAELSLYLGLRISEVLGLQWADINEVKQTLSICRSAVDGNVGKTKTAASRDDLPLSSSMLSLLHRWQGRGPASAEGWVFPSPSLAARSTQAAYSNVTSSLSAGGWGYLLWVGTLFAILTDPGLMRSALL